MRAVTIPAQSNFENFIPMNVYFFPLKKKNNCKMEGVLRVSDFLSYLLKSISKI